MQCPKCREVVALESAPGAPAVDELKAELEALRAEVERLSALEVRLLALEKTLAREAEVEVSVSTREPEPVAPGIHMKWLPRPEPESHGGNALDPRREEILQYNLEQSPGRAITIRSAAGDPHARELAERFKAVFERSHWHVLGVEETETPMVEPGIALAAGALPTPPDLATAYLAFTAAGFELVSRLDPKLKPREAVLFVA